MLTPPSSIAAAWAARASALAQWVLDHLVNRVDCHGQYTAEGKTFTSKETLTLGKLVDHFRGFPSLGLHLISVDNLCRSAGWDIDQHQEDAPEGKAAANFAVALALFQKLERMGMHPLLVDSNGNGGFHVLVYFDTPRAAREVHAWVQSIAPEGCEAFPKQDGVSPAGQPGQYGNYMRLVGRHHKRDHWSRIYVAGDWYEGDDAIDLILGWTPSPTDVIPQLAEEPQADAIPSASPTVYSPEEVLVALHHLQRLSPLRVDDYNDWVSVGMILHRLDPSPLMLAAWEAWSRRSSKYQPGECAAKWPTFNQGDGGKRLGVGTLIWMANQDYGVAEKETPSTPLDLAGPHGVTLRLIDLSRTPTRFNSRFEVIIDGTAAPAELCGSDTNKGARDAWPSLREILADAGKQLTTGQEEELHRWFKQTFARRTFERLQRQVEEARQRKSAGAPPRRTMLQITVDFMTEFLGLAFVEGDPLAVWSEKLGVLMRQGDFVSRVEGDLLESIKAARDYPAPTATDPTKPIKHLQQVLKPAWCAITATLPREVSCRLGPQSKAAARLRSAVTRLWLTPESWMKFDASPEAPAHVARMSLASRTRELVALSHREHWQRVLKGVNAFFRVRAPGQVWLAMRVDLAQGEIKGCCIHGVQSQHDLAVLCNRYGIADATGVPPHITDDSERSRVVVLSREMCDYILNCEDPEIPPLRADAPSGGVGATQLLGREKIDMTTGEVLDAD